MAGAAKDFLDHLRLVHFSIVLVSATVVITTLDGGNQDTRRDLTTVESLIDQQKPLADMYRGLTYGNLERLVRPAIVPKGPIQNDDAGTLTLHVDQADFTASAQPRPRRRALAMTSVLAAAGAALGLAELAAALALDHEERALVAVGAS